MPDGIRNNSISKTESKEDEEEGEEKEEEEGEEKEEEKEEKKNNVFFLSGNDFERPTSKLVLWALSDVKRNARTKNNTGLIPFKLNLLFRLSVSYTHMYLYIPGTYSGMYYCYFSCHPKMRNMIFNIDHSSLS